MRPFMPTCREKIMNRHRTRLVSTILLLLLSQSVVGAQVEPADQDVRTIPESETDFFLTLIEAQLSFVKDAQGQVTQLILHQNGRDTPAKKIK